MSGTIKESSSGATVGTLDERLRNQCKADQVIRLFNLPMSPSSNTQYRTFRNQGKTYHAISKTYAKYKQSMHEYPFRFPYVFSQAKKQMGEWVRDGVKLEFHSVFFFKQKKIFTLEGRPQKLDTSNRIKALHDVVSEMLGVDDSMYFRIFAEKAQAIGDEMVCIEILPYRPSL